MNPTDAETALRQCCRDLCDRYPDLPRLRTIAAVGAYDVQIRGYNTDSLRLTKIIGYLLDSGFPVDPDFTVDTVNFREDRDWLREEGPADLVYIGYILKDKLGLNDSFSGAASLKAGSVYPHNLNWTLSRRHYPEFWQERAKAAGAKIIATYGGDREIGPDFFTGLGTDLDHAVLVKTQTDQECPGGVNLGAALRDIYPHIKNNDLPLCWLGFSADRDYMRQIGPALTMTTLAAAARKIALSPQPDDRKPLINPASHTIKPPTR